MRVPGARRETHVTRGSSDMSQTYRQGNACLPLSPPLTLDKDDICRPLPHSRAYSWRQRRCLHVIILACVMFSNGAGVWALEAGFQNRFIFRGLELTSPSDGSGAFSSCVAALHLSPADNIVIVQLIQLWPFYISKKRRSEAKGCSNVTVS